MVAHAHGPEPASPDTAAVHLTVENRSDQVDALTHAAQQALLREEVTQGASTQIVMVPRLEEPAGGSVHLRLGGYHLMLTGLRRPLKAGERFHVTLKFEQAGQVTVSVPVVTCDQVDQ